MPAATKFLTITTDNQDLNRVQANVSEALRHLQNNIINITNTIVYETFNNPSNPPSGMWDSILTNTVTTDSNIQTTALEWAVTEGTIETCLLTVSGLENQPFFDVHGTGVGLVIRRNYTDFARLINETNIWQGNTSGMTSGILMPNTGVARYTVTGALNRPASWKIILRRMIST